MPGYQALEFRTGELNNDEMYKLMIGSVVPRPIAWVTTISKNDNLNLAPFSFFTVASRNPPTLLISVGPGVGERTGTVKDTLTNIRETGEFVINMVPAQLCDTMKRSAAEVEPDQNEFALAGVTPIASKYVKAPSVLEAPIAFELTLDRIIPVGQDHLILGTILRVQVDPEAYSGDYKTNIDAWRPLASLAGDFAVLGPRFD